MNVTFWWKENGSPRRVDVEMVAVPRVGDIVAIDYQISKDDWLMTRGKVEEVVWGIGARSQIVQVSLGET